MSHEENPLIFQPDHPFQDLIQVEMWNTEVLEALLNILQVSITIVDAEGIVRFWNQAAVDLYQIPAATIIGKPISEFSWKNLMLERVLKDKMTIREAYHEPKPNVHVLINAAPIQSKDKKLLGAISSEQDVTHLVRLGNELMQTSSQWPKHMQVSSTQHEEDPFLRVRGHSQAIMQVIDIARRVAGTDATVLLTGESGVGKELFAHALHQGSPRHKGPFVAINCGAIPHALFESELFGYAPGAFTGADRKGRIGKLELAEGGTLFLDEVGELPYEMQVKLLRVLEERSFYRIGGELPIQVNIRIVAATNRDLQTGVKEGKFREDLFYRLNVVSLELPSLRDRKEDIPILIHQFIREFALRYNRPLPELEPEVMIAMMNAEWPGNVRQLKNTIERLVILADDGKIKKDYLPSGFAFYESNTSIARDEHESYRTFVPEPVGAKTLSPEQLLATLKYTYGNRSAAAKQLGISRGTLYKYLNLYGIH